MFTRCVVFLRHTATQCGLIKLQSITSSGTNLCHKFDNETKIYFKQQVQVTHRKQKEKYVPFFFTLLAPRVLNDDHYTIPFALWRTQHGSACSFTPQKDILVCIRRNTSVSCTGYVSQIKSIVTLYNLHFLNGKRYLTCNNKHDRIQNNSSLSSTISYM